MKICSVQAVIAMTLCSLAFAHDNYGQVLDKKITIRLEDASIEEALEAIGELTNVKFFYSVDQLGVKEKISFAVVDRSLRDLLDELLAPYGIRYKVHERKSAITLKRGEDKWGSDFTGKGQGEFGVEATYPPGTIMGRVTDAATNQPMAGVNIIIQGTTDGTTTDADGNYAIWGDDNDVLVFSFIGYMTVETEVSSRTVIDVMLYEDIKSLKEVVVNAGYYTITKVLQTGNIAKIESKDIENQPVSDPLAALQGRVAGLEVTQSNGIPGSNFTVRIRGTNSIASGNDPLYIVDGVPYTSTSQSFGETSGGLFSNGTSPLNNINPGDIQSVEILKDADATAIYGSRAANGVILITTKRGQQGKTAVALNIYSGIGQVAREMDLLSTEQYVAMRREAFANDGIIPTASQAPDLLTWDTTRYTNWQEKLIGGTAKINDGRISIAGGNASTQFRIGTGYRSETTVFPGESGTDRMSFNVSIDNISSSKKFKTSFSATYSRTFSDLLSQDLTGRAISLAPNAPPLYDERKELNWEGWTPFYENPLAFLERTFEATSNNLIANTVLSYLILPELEAKVNLGYTSTGHKALTMIPISSLSPEATPENKSIFSTSQFDNWIIEPQLNWKAQFGEGSVDLLMGTTFLEQGTDGLAQYANGFTSETLMRNITAASDITNGTSYYTQYRYHAIFGRMNYNFKSRYILNLTGRRDGSSRFGPGNQFAFFKAVGVAWIFSNEPIIRAAFPFLSHGKLRGSFGSSGNDQIGDYRFLDTYAVSSQYQSIVGLTPSRLNNPDFAWEENKKLEFGIEVGAVDDRVILSFSYYRNRSSSQLIGKPLAPTTGFGNIQDNFPATVQNNGIEIELNTRNIVRRGFTWLTSINATIPRNKLIEFPDIKEFPAYDQQYEVGKPLTIIKRYHFVGIDPTTGFYAVEDVDGDGFYNIEDRHVSKFRGRNFYGGIQNSLNYKGFQLDVLFQYVKQEGFNDMRMFPSAPGTLANQPVQVLNRVQHLGEAAPIQRFTATGQGVNSYSNFYFLSDALFGDASFIRLKSLAISYGIPSGVVKGLMSEARVFIQGQNLLTFTNYDGLDPETSGSAILPPLRTITAGVHLNF